MFFNAKRTFLYKTFLYGKRSFLYEKRTLWYEKGICIYAKEVCYLRTELVSMANIFGSLKNERLSWTNQPFL